MSVIQSSKELKQNLEEYRSQQEQVEHLLLSEPDNAEYAEIYRSLEEAIELTVELLKESGGNDNASKQVTTKIVTEAPSMHIPSMLPPQVAEQIRKAQQKAALLGQAPAAWAIGTRCQACSSVDGQWYTCKVTGVAANGNFVVKLDGAFEEEEYEKTRIRPTPDEMETYRGVAAPKRKAVEAIESAHDFEITEIPKWLEIKDTDNEKTKLKKRKLQKSFKSKIRFQKMDQATRHRQQSWVDFRNGKGSKKKAGFLSTGKKESIFSVPDNPDAKVGVTGSGKGMTEFRSLARHDLNG